MGKTYKLATLRDVYEQVPTDLIEACLAEIAQGMLQAKALRELLDVTSAELGGGSVGMQWPELCEWTDDDAQIITIGVSDGDGVQLTIETGPNVQVSGNQRP